MTTDSGNGYDYEDFYDEEMHEQELHREDDTSEIIDFHTFLTACTIRPGTTFSVYWKDRDGFHVGIPTPEQIESADHRRIAEITVTTLED